MDAATTWHVISEIGRVLDAEVAYRNQECQMGSQAMSAIDRIKAKALQAKDIAPQAIRDFEADLDGIIAERVGLEQKRAAAVAPHKEAISGIYSEFDGLKQAMDILSNGGPPLQESATASPDLSIRLTPTGS